MKAYKKILSLILWGVHWLHVRTFWTNSLLHILYLKIIIEQKTKYKLALIDFIQIYSRRTGEVMDCMPAMVVQTIRPIKALTINMLQVNGK